MAIRSWLFVPGDSEKKLGKVIATGADAIIVDLEDSVAPHNKESARRMARQWLEVNRKSVLVGGAAEHWVRINPLDTPFWREDLLAVLPGAPKGIMVPKANGPEHVRMVAAELYEQEQRAGIPLNSTQILPLVSETPQAAVGIPAYGDPALTMPRVAGLTWGAEDLSAAIGATRKRDEHGQWTDLFRMVRAQTLIAAHAKGVAAVDTLYDDFRDEDGLRRIARNAYADGFTGMLAIHPAQVKIINEAFTPSKQQIAEALAIVDAFAAQPGVGAVQVDGKMVDRPHLEMARKLLDRQG